MPLQAAGQEAAAPAVRPQIQAQRWQEDWSPLADPALRTEALDWLKYIPLADTATPYLSLGGNVRERLETLDAQSFGLARSKADTYLLDRVQLHADLRAGQWQAFVQLADDRAPGKTNPSPADADRLDLEQAFVAHVGALGDGTLMLRAGRQEFAFDLQRFVSTRDGPNVRQSFDALAAAYETGPWRIGAFASHPVQTRDGAIFDDGSAHSLVLDGVRVERHLGDGAVAAYYLRYEAANTSVAAATGPEALNVLDTHASGTVGTVDFDAEIMGQQGLLAGRPVLAWAVGAHLGRTYSSLPWQPRIFLQGDAASGNSSRTGTIGTFNPLFPNGSYFTLANLTTYANLLHLKPGVSVAPAPGLTLQAATGFQWRQTSRDAVYTIPSAAVPGTAGRGPLWTGAYLQLDASQTINPHMALSVELVRYQVGATLRRAGGHDVSYGSLQLALAW